MGDIGPDEKIATREVSKEALLDLESNAQLDHDPWLLDDHPLRSYPTECIPGLSDYLDKSIGKRALFFRIGCIILTCLAAFQCLRSLPVNPQPFPSRDSAPNTHVRPHNSACTFPLLDTRPHALRHAFIQGCEGLRTAVWMHNGELQIGNVVAGPEDETFLQRLGLGPLLGNLDAEDDAPIQAPWPEAPGGLHADRTFLLMFDVKTSLVELFPRLVEQLDILRQRGHLSHWDGRNVLQRPVTVVITGEEFLGTDCIAHSYSDLFWSALPEARITSDFTKDGLRHLVPVCIA